MVVGLGVFAKLVVVVQLFFVWVVALWVMLASSGEEWRRYLGQNRGMGEKREIDFFFLINIFVVYIILISCMKN